MVVGGHENDSLLYVNIIMSTLNSTNLLYTIFLYVHTGSPKYQTRNTTNNAHKH
jgi:hypothetical protein